MRADFSETLIQIAPGLAMAARIYAAAPGAPLVLHLHGGSFATGSLDQGRAIAGMLNLAGAVVVSADYPVGAEHPFPEAIEATFALLQHLHRFRARWAGKAARLFVAGEEAGGNLAAALAMMARDRGAALSGQILVSPMLDAGMATGSLRNACAGHSGCKWAEGWRRYLGVPQRASHPYAAPGAARRLAGLAPALVLAGEDDPMRDEATAYAQRLRQSGVAVRELVLPAPTRWPDALRDAEPRPEWGAAVTLAMRDFLSATPACALPLPSISSAEITGADR